MVTVASEVTVPSALRLIPISPLPTVAGTIDIGAALRPAPAFCGAPSCLVHQTTPATTSKPRINVRTRRRRGRGLGICEGSTNGASLRDFIGWFMNLPSHHPHGRFRQSSIPDAAVCLPFWPFPPAAFDIFAEAGRINNRKDLYRRFA